MGCAVSTDVVSLPAEVPKDIISNNSDKAISGSDPNLLLIKSKIITDFCEKEKCNDDVISFPPDSAGSETIGFALKDTPPTAKATIIRGKSAHEKSTNNNTSVSLPHQINDLPPSNNIILTPKHGDSEASVRRRSAGDLGNVTRITCIPRSLVKSNALLNSGFKEVKTKTPLFGPRNRHLKLTESQKDFFEMLDQKIAQGRDYCSEDEMSLSSSHSLPFICRSNSNQTNGILTSSFPQQVR